VQQRPQRDQHEQPAVAHQQHDGAQSGGDQRGAPRHPPIAEGTLAEQDRRQDRPFRPRQAQQREHEAEPAQAAAPSDRHRGDRHGEEQEAVHAGAERDPRPGHDERRHQPTERRERSVAAQPSRRPAEQRRQHDLHARRQLQEIDAQQRVQHGEQAGPGDRRAAVHRVARRVAEPVAVGEVARVAQADVDVVDDQLIGQRHEPDEAAQHQHHGGGGGATQAARLRDHGGRGV